MLRHLLLFEETDPTWPVVIGRGAVWCALLVWGWRFLRIGVDSGYPAASLLHLVNLPFHEAGHILFRPLGHILSVWGGSLLQWIMPALVAGEFLRRRNPFGASVGLWWFGESFIDIAPYANDARAGKLLLLGGVTGSEVEDYHDWEMILRTLGWLRHDHAIATGLLLFGKACILLALIWGGMCVYRQARAVASSGARG